MRLTYELRNVYYFEELPSSAKKIAIQLTKKKLANKSLIEVRNSEIYSQEIERLENVGFLDVKLGRFALKKKTVDLSFCYLLLPETLESFKNICYQSDLKIPYSVNRNVSDETYSLEIYTSDYFPENKNKNVIIVPSGVYPETFELQKFINQIELIFSKYHLYQSKKIHNKLLKHYNDLTSTESLISELESLEFYIDGTIF